MGYDVRGRIAARMVQQKKRTKAVVDETPTRTALRSKPGLGDLVPEFEDGGDDQAVFTTWARVDAEEFLSWLDHAQSRVGDKKTATKLEQYGEDFAKVPRDILEH